MDIKTKKKNIFPAILIHLISIGIFSNCVSSVVIFIPFQNVTYRIVRSINLDVEEAVNATRGELEHWMYEAYKFRSEISSYPRDVERHNLFMVVDNKWRLRESDFNILVDNLKAIKKIVGGYNGPSESLISYIQDRWGSGFLKLDKMRIEDGLLKFEIGGCIDVVLNVENLKIVSESGLSFLPTSNYYQQAVADIIDLDDLDMDGEANMGLDTALSWAEMAEEEISKLQSIEKRGIELAYEGRDEPIEIKLAEEEVVKSEEREVSSESLLQDDFFTLDDKANIINLLNELYYAAFGGEAFGRINKQGTLEEANAKQSAKEFYYKIKELDQTGELDDEIIIQEWGAGDGYSASVFLDTIYQLDQENGTNYYKKLKYILIDYSPKVIQDLEDSPYLVRHRDVVEFKQADALDMREGLPKAYLIRANFLLNSLYKKIVKIENGRFYELTTRGYIDMEKSQTFTDKEGNAYSLSDLKRIVEEKDIETLRKLGKEFFDLIKWQQKYVEIDVGSLVYGEYLKSLENAGFEGEITLDIGAKIALENMLANLKKNGMIQIADSGTLQVSRLDDDFIGELIRFYGAVYSPVNFHFLNSVLPVSITETHQVDFGREFLESKIKFQNVVNILSTFRNFKKYFNADTFYKRNGREEVLAPLSEELMQKYGGFTEEGLEEFKERLSNEVQLLNRRTIEEIALSFRETMLEVDNYADAYVYWVYNRFIQEKFNLLEKQSWLIPGTFQQLFNDEEHLPFAKFCAIYHFDKAVESIFDDLATFYPGLMIFDILPR